MATTIGGVNIRIGANTKQLEYDLQRAERALKKTADNFKSIGTKLSLGITAPMAAMGAASFKMASDLDESLNKVRVAFGDSAGSVEKFAESTLKTFGIAKGTALDMSALFGDMATSMGLPRDAAARMSTSMVGLAGDLSSFKNIAIEEVQTALAGVFTGETESLKRLGIVMTEANVQAFALTQGITKQWKEMTQAEKVALRYQYVISSTKNAQGDFARTSGGAANQMRIYQESIKELSASFGQVLLPVITPIIKKVNDLIQWFGTLSDETKKTIVIIAGIAAAVGPVLLVIGQLVTSYGAVVGAMKGVIAGSSLLKGAIAAVGFAPMVAGALALAAAIGGLVIAYKKYNDTAVNAYKNEKAGLEGLVRAASNNNISQQTRSQLYDEINKKYPQYLQGINLEKEGIEGLNKVLENYNRVNTLAGARERDRQSELIKLQEEKAKVLNRIVGVEKNIAKGDFGASIFGKAALDANYKEIEKIEKKINDLTNVKVDRGVGIADRYRRLREEGIPQTTNNAPQTDFTGIVGVEKVKKDVDKIAQSIIELDRVFKAGLITTTEYGADKIKILTEQLKTLIEKGADPASEAVQRLKDQITDLTKGQLLSKLPTINKEVVSTATSFTYGGKSSSDLAIEYFNKNAKISDTPPQAIIDLEEAEKKWYESIEAFNQTATGMIRNLATNVAVSFGETLGNLASGDISGLQNFFRSVLIAITDFGKALGQQLIALGTAKIALDKLFKGGGGVGAIAAGIGLVAISQIVKNIVSKGVPSLAIGTDRVNSDGLAYLHKGERVVPADVVKGGYTGGYGSRPVEAVIRGQDLRLVSNFQAYLDLRMR